jgi:hypothetical protein
MNRLFDLIAVGCIAFVVLLPKASVQARPALDAEQSDLQRVSSLEDALVRAPHDAPDREVIATDLAELYNRLERPDWALITLASFPAESSSARLSLVRATAYADRLDAASAVAATTAGRTACEKRGCPDIVSARLQIIEGPMKALLDAHIDPRKDQQRAKQIVGQVLHNTRPAQK